MGNLPIDGDVLQALKEADLEIIDPKDESAERDALRVTLEGVGGEEQDLAQLLEDTAKFVRAMEGQAAAAPFEHREYVFKRLKIGDFVIMSNRS